ncbi:MAG: P-type conjugative transfer ATPase TrbB [Ferrimonas sp.]
MEINRYLTPLSSLLSDKEVIEILLNADGRIWVERLGHPPELTDIKYNPSHAMLLIKATANSIGRSVDAINPILECELPDGSRFEALIPPISKQPIFSIRRRALKIFSLDDYVAIGSINEQQKTKLSKSVETRKNILICGGTGTGKTTFANALLAECALLTPLDRVVLIEDLPELQSAVENSVSLRTSPSVSMSQLLRATLRLRPDRISVGEVRGQEAAELVKAWNTGHGGGIATIHADSAYLALDRLESCIREGGASYVNQRLIAEAINVIVSIERHNGMRRVSKILSVDYHDGDYVLTEI